MMRSRIVPAFFLLALVACDDVAGPGETALTADEVAALSDAMVDDDFGYTGQLATAGGEPDGVALDPQTTTTEFTATRSCPAGGQVAIEGSHVRTWDRDTHSGTADLSLVKTHQECAREIRDVVLTIDGDPSLAVEAHHAWENGARAGVQTLAIEGGFTWATDDGRAGRCPVEIQAVFDPDTRTRTVSGTFCNRTFERTTTWTGAAQGG